MTNRPSLSELCRRQRYWRYFLAFGVCLNICGTSDAVNTISETVTDKNSGLSVKFTSTGINKSGYRALDLTVRRTGPVNADRNVVVIVNPRRWNHYYSSNPSVRGELELPQGSASTTKRFLVPQYGVWNSLSLKVFDNGKYVKELAVNIGLSGKTAESTTETFPGWWFIDADFDEAVAQYKAGRSSENLLPNIRTLVDFMPQYDYEHEIKQKRRQKTSDAEILGDINKLSTANLTGLSELPTNWLEYTSYDIAVVSLDDLRQLKDEYPERFEALLRFVRNGANLLVYRTGTKGDFARQMELNSVLEIAEDSPRNSLWKKPLANDYFVPLTRLLPNIEYYANDGNYVTRGTRVITHNDSTTENTSDEATNVENPNRRPVPKASFRIRSFGLGRVVSISAQTPFIYRRNDDRGHRQWKWILTSLGDERWKWYQRHGLSCARTNADFWEFLIEGVGAAPVIPFLVLITGFVLAIGPANYLVLRKWNRLYLLLFTVPIGALIVTSGLLAYAFLGDGLSTRLRARSFTLLDHTSGEAISWSRQSYYAGLPPSDGIDFPSTAAVYPIVYAPDEEHNSTPLLRWTKDRQILARGYLRTRTLSQMLVCNSTRADKTISVVASKTLLRVKNDMSSEIELLIAIDPVEKCCYLAESIPAGKDVELTPMDIESARVRTTELLSKNKLTIPKRVDFGQRRVRYWKAIDSVEGSVNAGTSILENSIDELQLREIPDGYVFYAVTVSSPEFVPLGVDKSNEEDGFHVIKGTWEP